MNLVSQRTNGAITETNQNMQQSSLISYSIRMDKAGKLSKNLVAVLMRSFWKTFSMMCYFAMLISVKFEWIDEVETRRVRSHANARMFLNDVNDAVI